MKRILFFFTLLIAAVLIGLQPSASPAYADGAINVTSSTFTSNFRVNLQFQLAAQSSAKISQVALFIQIDNQPSSARQVPKFTPDTQIRATYTWNLTQNYLPPGVSGDFWWTLKDDAGNQLQTPKQRFRVEDNAHTWQKLSNDKIALFWYLGDQSFGKALFDRANQAIQYLQQDTGVVVDQQVQIYIYGNHADLINALETAAQEWTGGENFPDYGVVLIGVAPSDLDWGLGATTHELTHQIIHQKIRGPLGSLSMPHWMDEGLAVYYQTIPGTLDAQFKIPLQRAIQNNTLLPLRTLSSAFAADPDVANLSYAESYSVVDFIIRHFGRPKLTELLQAFKQGGTYDKIFTQVLGVDTDGLENLWRKDVGAPQRTVPTRSANQPTPFPTYSLSTDTTPVPTSAPGSATATSAPVAAAATAAPIATSAPQAQAPNPTPSTSGNPVSNLCGGLYGFIALGIVGAAWQWRKRRSRR